MNYAERNNLVKISNIGVTIFVELNSGWHVKEYFSTYDKYLDWRDKHRSADVLFKEDGNWVSMSDLVMEARVKQGIKDIKKYKTIYVNDFSVATSIQKSINLRIYQESRTPLRIRQFLDFLIGVT